MQLGIPYGINNVMGKPDTAHANAILAFAKQAGITTLDTAKAYGNAMEVIGNFHKQSGSSFKVISKFHAGSENLENDIELELALLHITQFEAYLFHSFADFEQVNTETLNTLKNFKQKNLIQKIGVSVYGNDQFEKAIKNTAVDIIQLPYNLLDNAFQREALMKEAKAKGKELHVRSVFLQGLFFMNPDLVPDKIKALGGYLNTLAGIAAANKLTMHELALGYALQNPYIDKVLIGVDSEAQLALNVNALEKSKTIPAHIYKEADRIAVKEVNLLSPVNWN